MSDWLQNGMVVGFEFGGRMIFGFGRNWKRDSFIEVWSGVGALKAVQATMPHLVLLDNQMPDMTGLEVSRIIKQDKRTQFIPVIIVTVLGSEQD